MPRFFLTLLAVLGLCVGAFAAVAPIPESEQAALALRILDAYHGPRPDKPPKLLHLVYFTPSDREPAGRYAERLEAIMKDIAAFYRDGMSRCGFGARTFTMAQDEQGRVKIHLVKGKLAESAFPGWEGRNGGNTGAPEGGDKVRSECQPVLEAAGIHSNRETFLFFCHLATFDEKALTFRHHSPYFGMTDGENRMCFAADWAQQDLANLTKTKPMLHDAEYGRMTLGKHTTIFIGGIAHELGHALALPHCGARWDEKKLGTSLMGSGNHTYREEMRNEGPGSFLAMGSVMRLAANPLFSGSAKGIEVRPQLTTCKLSLSTNLTRADLIGRRSGLRLEGVCAGTLPIYGVVAYFDSARDGGYRAPSATAVPDEQGRFAIEISDLASCSDGDLRVEFCHVNGAVSEKHLGFRVLPDGRVDLSQWELRQALETVALAVEKESVEQAEAALAELETSQTSESTLLIARKLVKSLRPESKPSPAEVPATETTLALGDAKPVSAAVGWLAPAANRIPRNAQITSPFIDSEELYPTGLYAHAPSKYVFDLGGKWKELSGEAGLHTLQQPYGSVVFIIKADAKELFRSGAIRGSKKAAYKLSVADVNRLELEVDPAGNGNGNDWGLWLAPILTR